MSSSGIKKLNLMKAQNYNISTKHQYSTKPAIAYTRCYTQCGLFSRKLN